ncbi:hypothetical protein Cme02nite_69060 [Catellatospora methionotrophica]|uniref:Uncharacterized protein n=1 Tax=Catellatospora methionotrophica TaxID=121620 RepID=A0A8J3PJA9_9ACTN|nr:hypothetical protein [Catellatospora methionotrophica]GIG18574.1 hypothetical protein Cme02nite_69060 [Catellatospora methionotrophica]
MTTEGQPGRQVEVVDLTAHPVEGTPSETGKGLGITAEFKGSPWSLRFKFGFRDHGSRTADSWNVVIRGLGVAVLVCVAGGLCHAVGADGNVTAWVGGGVFIVGVPICFGMITPKAGRTVDLGKDLESTYHALPIQPTDSSRPRAKRKPSRSGIRGRRRNR